MKSKSKKLTLTALAKKLGVSRQLLGSHIKTGGAPTLDDIEAWRIFLAAHGRSGSAPPDLRRKIAEQRLAILKEQRAALARKNAQEAGELMPVASAVRQAGEAMGYTFSELERMAREIPPALAGGTAVEIGKRIAAEVERIRSTLKEKFQTIPE
jgi:transcriptional regulator with XRE-family HTH domain